jgi:hypothetical protein
MPTINLWLGVSLTLEAIATRATAKTISAITKANPGVVTSTSHGYANGDYVILPAISGMKELNGRMVRVANVAANTWEIENVDTTNFTTFTSGSSYKVTLSKSASTFVDVNASGGEAADVGTETIHDTIAKPVPGLKSALKYDLSSIWDPADPALIECKLADDTLSYRGILIGFQSGAKVGFVGYVSCPLAPTGSTGDKVVTPVGVKLLGPTTAWST